MEHNQAARAFSAWIRAKAMSSSEVSAVDLLEDQRRRNPAIDAICKTAVATGTSTDANWASALRTRSPRAFLDLAARATLLGGLGPMPAPPHTPIPFVTAEPTAEWTAEGAPAPVARMSVDRATTSISSFRFILAFSKELTRLADDRALSLIERHAIRSLRHAEDTKLLSDEAAIEGTRPAGLLYGQTPLGGGSPANLSGELEDLWTSVVDGDPDRPTFVASPRGGMYLAALRDDSGPLFPDVGPLGGTIAGVPVLTSRAAGNRLILLDASRLIVTDEGLEVESSGQAAVQMDDSPTPGAVQLVSAFQANTSFVRFVRFLHWTLIGADSIAYIELPLAGSPQ